jgi:SMC interacting uncharacterized protein involved in chromosome segregation
MPNTREQELLELIVQKFNDSRALNGGFDKLCLMIEHVQTEQDKNSGKLDKVSDALYDPDHGLFARVKKLEQKIDSNLGDLDQIVKGIPTVETKVTALVTKVESLEKKAETQTTLDSDTRKKVQDLEKFHAQMEKIGGVGLNEFTDIVALKQRMSNIYWALALAIMMFVGKLLFELAKR